ncbi:sensor histidine kinase [Methanosalsum zhilinae]|nr:histidine kinase dimerization/phosphoacceptor domain -containing protein [Methanosalsum zhilinae]
MKFNQSVIDTLRINIVLLDMDGTIVSYNKQWIKFAEENDNCFLKNSGIGSNYLDVTKKAMVEGDKVAEEAFEGIMDLIKGQSYEFEMEYPCHSPDEKRWFTMHAVILADHDLIVIYHEDITDRKMYEENLKSSQQKYKNLAESAHAILWEYDIFEDHWNYVAPQVTDILGYLPDEWTDLKFWEDRIHPADHDRVIQYFTECVECREPRSIEYRFFKKDGTFAWIKDVFDVDLKSREPTKIQGFMIDITEYKLLEEMEKKEILLKEVHHRVKNNLQVIESLLSMQARKFDDESVKAAFSDSQNRVKSMLIAHKILYDSGDLDNIEISDYIEKLGTSIFKAYNVNENIKLNVNSDSAHLNMDILVPLALIITEIITNSIKHAFPIGNEGAINIIFKKLENDKYLLKVTDDGIGIPDDFDIERSESLGLKLINMLVQQLQGTVNIDNSNGTSYAIIF